MLVLKQHSLASENGDAFKITGILLFVSDRDLKWGCGASLLKKKLRLQRKTKNKKQKKQNTIIYLGHVYKSFAHLFLNNIWQDWGLGLCKELDTAHFAI